ncbi:hypothetical protein Tco_0877278 [Tanacetum coccineum]|uniref:Reverse transcriptase/retrotransposon-derived protein RNase H-like domain-containing protein n=1 Tax=Tanacetum coccineum TaxID=301880 RepID=A0ABQ5BXL5_9ASTR
MEELVNKFIEEGEQEHEKMDAFIREFRTTSELLLKERNNSLRELEFKVYGLSREINKAQMHDKQAQTKETPKKLTYDNSKEEGSRSSKKRGLSKRSFDGSSGTTRTRSKARSSGKIQRSLSHIKTSSQLRRSRRSGEGGTRLDFDYEDGLKDTCKDLSTPYKRPKSTAFPSRITRFKYHRRAKLLRNIKVYKGSKDLEDHLGIFSAATEQEEWPMAIWCKMFCQTLSGAARNWFHDLDPKMDEMFEKVRAFIRGEVAAVSVEIVRAPQWDQEEHGCVRLDAGSGYGCASVRHGAPVENIPLSKTNSLEEAVPKSRPKKGAKGESDGTWQVLTVFTSLNKVCPKVHVVILDVKGKGWDPLKGFGQFIPKLAELIFPFRDIRRNHNTEEIFKWTSGAEKTLQGIKKELGKLQTLAIPKEGETLMVCLRPRSETISAVLITERNRLQIPIHYVICPLQGMEICYTSTEKTVLTLIPGASGRLALWAIKLKTYYISYLPKEKAEGQVAEKFLVKKEQVSKVSKKGDNEAFGTKEGPSEELVPGPKSWRLYIGREASKEGFGVGLILIDPEEKEYSHAVGLNFHASKDDMDYEALLVGLVFAVGSQMKDLHVFVNLKLLVDQVEGNIKPRMRRGKDM